MKRLTIDRDTQYDFIGKYDTNIEEFANNKELRIAVMNKLGQLEDIEEKIGIELVVLFKAVKEGFIDNKRKYHHFNNVFFDKNAISDGYSKEAFLFKEYGKTWALTKEELE